MHLETLAVHQRHEALDEFWLSLSELLPVVGVHGDVAERSGAVILHVGVWRVEQADKDGDGPGVDELLSVLICTRSVAAPKTTESLRARRPADPPECVMLRSAPVALRCTRMSLDFASLVSGTSAPDLAIWVLFSSAMRVSKAML